MIDGSTDQKFNQQIKSLINRSKDQKLDQQIRTSWAALESNSFLSWMADYPWGGG